MELRTVGPGPRVTPRLALDGGRGRPCPHRDALLQTAASALLQFTGAHPDYRILSLEHEVIIYDIHITDVLGHALETHSYAFSDGSTIVIVGLAPDYHVGV